MCERADNRRTDFAGSFGSWVRPVYGSLRPGGFFGGGFATSLSPHT